jgi:hypothetical protein
MRLMPHSSGSEAAGQLQEILAGSENAVEFLAGLSKLAAAAVSAAADDEIECGVTVKIKRRPATVAGSSERAAELDQIEQAVGDGPCVKALREMSPVTIDDVASDPRWPELARRYAEAGVLSSLGVPLEISNESSAALNFFATKPGVFTANVYDKALGFAAAAHSTLRLSVRLNVVQNRAKDLEAALEGPYRHQPCLWRHHVPKQVFTG